MSISSTFQLVPDTQCKSNGRLTLRTTISVTKDELNKRFQSLLESYGYGSVDLVPIGATLVSDPANADSITTLTVMNAHTISVTDTYLTSDKQNTVKRTSYHTLYHLSDDVCKGDKTKYQDYSFKIVIPNLHPNVLVLEVYKLNQGKWKRINTLPLKLNCLNKFSLITSFLRRVDGTNVR